LKSDGITRNNQLQNESNSNHEERRVLPWTILRGATVKLAIGVGSKWNGPKQNMTNARQKERNKRGTYTDEHATAQVKVHNTYHHSRIETYDAAINEHVE
jgi:hypothetical protein